MRSDISPNLIHFTKPHGENSAMDCFLSIVRESCLRGGTGSTRGGYQCVCFSEAPLGELGQGLVNDRCYSKYSPFGIMVSKAWLYSRGGRPVIYQSDNEYSALPESHRWRHVRYELGCEECVDFTWEREWRIHTTKLVLSKEHCALVVPGASEASFLLDTHTQEQDMLVRQYSLCVGSELAEAYREDFGWRIVVLDQ